MNWFTDWLRNQEPGLAPERRQPGFGAVTLISQQQFNEALRRSMDPIPGSQTEADEKAGLYRRTTYGAHSDATDSALINFGAATYYAPEIVEPCPECGEHDVSI